MANGTVDKLKKLQADAKVVLNGTTVLRREDESLTPFQQFLHFWVLVAKSFVRNRCPVRASALAYASLLALVPMLAVVISVSSSLLKSKGEDEIGHFIEQAVANIVPQADGADSSPTDTTDQPLIGGTGRTNTFLADPRFIATRKTVSSNIKSFIGNIQSGTLGVTGTVALIFVAITMLARIETTFNDIWGVTRGRSWFARVVQYWAAITLGPLLLLTAMALTSGPYLQTTRDFLSNLPLGLGHLIQFLFRFLPFVILSLTFAVFYQLMPNTKVHWRAALVGGIVGGCLWQINNVVNVLYVSRVVTNSKIYGSLGMVPVFMIGLYFSWIILLFGAQVAYAFQNRQTYLQERQAEGVHQRGREFIALRLITQVAGSFQNSERPPTLTELAGGVGVPTRLAGQILQTLIRLKLLAEVAEGEAAYIPARPLGQITVQDVLQALRAGQGMELATRDDPVRGLLRSEFERVAEAEKSIAAGITVQELVDRLALPGAVATASPAPPRA